MMPAGYPSPQRALNKLPLILQGEYSIEHLADCCLDGPGLPGQGAVGMAFTLRRRDGVVEISQSFWRASEGVSPTFDIDERRADASTLALPDEPSGC